MTWKCKHEWFEGTAFDEPGAAHCIVCGARTTTKRRAAAAKAAQSRQNPERNADGFTVKQVEKADALLRFWLLRYGDTNRDVKLDRRENVRGLMLLFAVVGSKNDEGTIGALLCRERYTVAIRPEGGVSATVTVKNAKGRYVTRHLKGRAAVETYER